ncbi:MAG: hypothetical protein QG670_1495 [Thermoproteota archaeon]|nr:hypothetical protein [Thermoproteota archaeon]
MTLENRRQTTVFILSLIGWVLMVVNGGMMFVLFMNGLYGYGVMGGYQGMMGSFGVPFGFMSNLMLVGLAAGVIVIISAVILNTRPEEHWMWGIVILVFSVISFLGMGGFFVGAVLGITSGAFAISWKPSPKASEQ